MKKIAFSFVLLLFACSDKKPTYQQLEKESFSQQATTTKASLRQLQKEYTLTGKVIANPEVTIDHSPLVSGVIIRSYYSIGDHVRKGQAMVDIRSTELSGLQSELTIAKRNLVSTEALYQSGMATERELVEARSTLSKKEADLSLYGENIGGGIFSIKAPASGYVTQKAGSAGSTVSAGGESLFSISDLSSVWIVANVYATNLQHVYQGQSAQITTIAYPGKVFNGKIDFLSPVFDPEDKALKARIILPNSDLKLKPEMPVTVKLIFGATRELVAIRSDAVIFDNNNYFVVVKGKDFEIRQITLHDHHDGFTYISNGLQPEEEVVMENQLLIFSELKRELE